VKHEREMAFGNLMVSGVTVTVAGPSRRGMIQPSVVIGFKRAVLSFHRLRRYEGGMTIP
jgi:hypothetical protein